MSLKDLLNTIQDISSKVSESTERASKAQSRPQAKTKQFSGSWICIGPLKTANLTPYNHCVGLYRHVVNGKTMYIGRAIELNNGGFRKRLSDYRRDSDSARTHTSGRIINQHLDEIVTYILIVGDTEEAIERTKQLEAKYIAQYQPEWNKLLK